MTPIHTGNRRLFMTAMFLAVISASFALFRRSGLLPSSRETLLIENSLLIASQAATSIVSPPFVGSGSPPEHPIQGMPGV